MSLPQPPKTRVLLLSEGAHPDWVSVALEGWSQAQALARVADVHLVTQVRNRDPILQAGLIEGVDFTAIDTEALARPIGLIGQKLRGGDNKGHTLLTALSSVIYPYFETLVWRQFGPRIEAGEFDVVHRHLPLTPTAPSPIAGRCRRAGVPFVLGPLNGGLPWPGPFKGLLRREKEWLSYVRSGYKLLPGFHSTRRHASAIIAGSGDVLDQMPPRYLEKCVYIPENGVDPARFARKRTRQAGRPLRGVFIGRLVPYKGADMLLEAAAPLIRAGDFRLDVIGDGPQMPELRAIVAREGIEAGVTLHGWVQHEKVADHFAEADVLASPSVREFGGAVVLEAMAVGLVPIVVAYGGPGELATDRTGYLLPMEARPALIARLRSLLEAIAADPAQIEPKSRAAIRRVDRHFTWDAKARQILEVYDWALGRRPTKPDFPVPIPDDPVEAIEPAALPAV